MLYRILNLLSADLPVRFSRVLRFPARALRPLLAGDLVAAWTPEIAIVAQKGPCTANHGKRIPPVMPLFG